MIELYSGPGCQRCKAVKRELKKHDLEFTEFDTSENDGAANQVRALGYREIPVVIIREDGTIIEHWSGHIPDRIKTLAEEMNG